MTGRAVVGPCNICAVACVLIVCNAPVRGQEPVQLRVDFAQPDGTWNMPALALGQGGLQSDAMLEPHVKEVRQLRPRTIRLFLSEYYRIYPDHDTYDWTRLDRELRAVRAAGARPTLALAMKPPVLYPHVDHFLVHPTNYDEWARLCEALARHCREAGFEVAAWEVCNEPDIGETGGTPHFFRTTDDYNRFYTHTVAGLLRGDPDAQVGGPAVASADSMLVEGLIEHCATQQVPLHFLSWHLYSDSPAAHAANVAKQRARLARFPQLSGVRLFVSEWNMDLMRPNLAPGFQPCFVLDTMRRFAEAGLEMAAYYHIRDCFVDPADFDWMSPGGCRFMAHWWNTMPQYSALFDHHGRVRPAWYAFRMLGQLDGPRYHVEGERDHLRAIAGDGNGYKHLIIWRFEGDGPDEVEVRLDLAGVLGRSGRVVQLDASAPVNNLRVLHFGSAEDLNRVTVKLEPWGIRWIELE
ncbi:MAG: hypothetical protein MUF48_07450 [Pirellulaceae bacterium]|nr:hypothetical protein [Pirellulaceae bacterium]